MGRRGTEVHLALMLIPYIVSVAVTLSGSLIKCKSYMSKTQIIDMKVLRRWATAAISYRQLLPLHALSYRCTELQCKSRLLDFPILVLKFLVIYQKLTVITVRNQSCVHTFVSFSMVIFFSPSNNRKHSNVGGAFIFVLGSA